MVQPKQRRRDIRFGTWNVRNLYRLGSLTTAIRESAMYKLDLGGVQELDVAKGQCKSNGLYIFFFLRKRKRKPSIGNRIFFIKYRILSAVKRDEFVSDRV